ncbi:hypothetical protein [Actinomadura xylanilytica]|uniref:hypothetical protein n=1 Tax=Actinomadura xylanilytica TaxID=887459 RepID=UPI00255B11F0|nr:hypothetical protein [Actinomadura xylanilytica]MDL4770712.1 hypothetical protein [Actinomadura xylanilytica]
MTTEQHPDPIAEGFTHSGQRMVQIVALAAVVQQTCTQYKDRLRAARETREAEAEQAATRDLKAAFEEARSRWAPAHDRQWLRDADLLHVAQAWGAAVPYAADHTSAASVVAKCEERLRGLHPHAMSHYDRFREHGQDPLSAMSNAGTYFTRNPNVRTGDPAPRRPELPEGTEPNWPATIHTPDRTEPEEARQEQRARKIIDELGERLRIQGRDVDPTQMRTVLEVTTNLPDHIITKATGPTVRPYPRPSPQAGPAAEDFPHTIDQALAMAAKQPFEEASTRKSPPQSQDRNRRRNR